MTEKIDRIPRQLSGGEQLEVNVRLEMPEIGLVHSLQEKISVE